MLHTTKNGKVMPISSMEDSHLINMIKLLFRPYSIEVSEITSWQLGKEVSKREMNVEVFNKILSNYCFYFFEALRRKSTTEELISILSKYNPLWKSREVIAFDNTSLLTSSLQIEDEIDYDYDYDCDGLV